MIRLYDMEELGLIIECPSGVLYTNQAGGNFCLQPETEGVLVPLGIGSNIEDKLSALWEKAGLPFVGLEPRHADAIDRILRTPEPPAPVTPTFFLEVDRSRLADSMEAWLFVTIIGCPDRFTPGSTPPEDQPELGPHAGLSPIAGFGRRSGVLVWANSD